MCVQCSISSASEAATQLSACPLDTVSKRGIMLKAPTGQAFVQTSQPHRPPQLKDAMKGNRLCGSCT